MTDELRSTDGRHVVYMHSSTRMHELPDESVDLVVTSPPFGLGLKYGNSEEQLEVAVLSDADYEFYLRGMEPVWRESFRVLRKGGFACINAAYTHTDSKMFQGRGEVTVLPVPDDIARFWRGMGALYKCQYIWVATRGRWASDGSKISYLGSVGLPLEGCVCREVEQIVVLRKPKGADYELTAERKARREQSRLTTAGGDSEWNRCFSQVWEFPGARKESVNGEVVHPAPFPVELPRRLIMAYSVVGDTILDPFLGSGTTTLAAKELGRRSVGYEVEPAMASVIEAKTRLSVPPLTKEW